MEELKLKRNNSSYQHVDSNSAFKLIGDNSFSQLQQEPKNCLCPSFLRNSSFMKDCDLDSQLPSMQKNSSLFNKYAEPKLPEAEEKLPSATPLSVEERRNVYIKREVMAMSCGESVDVRNLERKVKVLIKEGVMEGKTKQEVDDEKKPTMDYSHEFASPHFQEVNQKIKEREDRRKVTKKAYTGEEDMLIFQYVKKYGEKNWSKIAELIPGRNRKQLRDHYINILKKKRNKNEFTEKEDSIICSMVAKFGNSWKRIADKLPGRTPLMIKNRYNAILRKKGTDTASIEKEDIKRVLGSEKSDDSLDSIRRNIVTKETERLRIGSK